MENEQNDGGVEEEQNDEEEEDEEESSMWCTYAATGSSSSSLLYQPIFVCHTCHTTPTSLHNGENPITTTSSNPDINRHSEAEAKILPHDDTESGENESTNDKKTTMTQNTETAVTPSTLPCLCQSCAFKCHQGHDVEYMGVGPSYCDCPGMTSNSSEGCQLIQDSMKMAKEQGVDAAVRRNVFLPTVTTSLSLDIREDDASSFGYVVDTYNIPELRQDATDTCAVIDETTTTSLSLSERLYQQAVELVTHTKDTHWIPSSIPKDSPATLSVSTLSELEQMALEIYQRHVEAYNLTALLNLKEGERCQGKLKEEAEHAGGAEWWVQVKPTDLETSPPASGDNQPIQSRKGGIDLHYDKDEALAECFDLGSFPTLSTVTYLTQSSPPLPSNHHCHQLQGKKEDGDAQEESNPTLVFPRTYHEDEDSVMTQVVLSYPRKGKHLVFDGRLLHGAPSHETLRRRGRVDVVVTQKTDLQTGHDRENDGAEKERTSSSDFGQSALPHMTAESTLSSPLRVTFLVNLWIGGRPSGVHVLSDKIRQSLLSIGGGANNDSGSISFVPQIIPCLEVSNRDDGASASKARERHVELSFADSKQKQESCATLIRLPFVSSDATWIAEEDQLQDLTEDDQVQDDQCLDKEEGEKEGKENYLHNTNNCDANSIETNDESHVEEDNSMGENLVVTMWMPCLPKQANNFEEEVTRSDEESGKDRTTVRIVYEDHRSSSVDEDEAMLGAKLEYETV